MVAVLILAIGLAALAFLYTNGTQIRTDSAVRQKAVQVAAERLELLKGITTHENLLTAISAANQNSVVNYSGDDNVKFTATLEANPQTLAYAGGELKGDELIYPVTVTVVWSGVNDPQGNKITLVTYMTVNS